MAAFGAMLSVPMFAHAAVVNSTTTDAVDFTVSRSSSDVLAAGATAHAVTPKSNSVSKSLAKFDANTGVLTGVKVNVASTYKQTTNVSSPANPSASNNGQSTATGQGTVAATVTVTGTGTSSTSNASPQQASCSNNRKSGCSASTGPASTTYNTTLAPAALNQYVATGADTTFGVETTASMTTQTTANSFAAGATTNSTVDWTGKLSATYEYLLHAAQSFDGSSALSLDLDFGSVYLGDSAADQLFSIFNKEGLRVGLQLTGVSETGNGNGMFSTNLNTYSNIAAGSSQGFKASFLANQLGSFSTSYRLTLADLAPSVYAANTLYSNYSLTLNLAGNVIARPVQNDVPEPATLMLLGLGAAAFGVSRKRKA